MRIEFFVPGIPRPGGSKKAFVLRDKQGNVIRRNGGAPIVNMTDMGGEKTIMWRNAVLEFAQKAYSGPLLTGPLNLSITFYQTRPKGHFGSGRNAGVLKESAPTFPVVKPDVTKLLRSTEDALKGIIWADDSQIVTQIGQKRYADKPGAQIVVSDATWGGA